MNVSKAREPASARHVKAANPVEPMAGVVNTEADLKLCAQAIAPWEGTEPLPFAVEALKNIAAELFALEMALYPEDGGGLSDSIAHRVLAGIQNRAESAATLAERLAAQDMVRS